VRAVKDPRSLAEACARLGVPHPAISLAAPPDDGWLRKRIGGAGGEHIAPAIAGTPPAEGYYLQRRVAGQPVSALFLADGERALVLGLSRQWADPAPGQPFRYGGAAQPAVLPPGQMSALRAGLDGLSRAFGLRGLNSADLLARDDSFFLLEINPRPGATLDLFPACRLFALHVAACNLRLPAAAPREPLPTAAAIVYAPAAVIPPPGFAWPDWASDRQAGGVAVAAGQPLCSVRAAGADAEATVRRRAEAIIAAVEDAACRSA
jgi:predicted ATP-grasp superfamily ATP-dependent carboligase